MGNKEKKGRKEEKRKEDITGMKNWLNYLFICLSVGEKKWNNFMYLKFQFQFFFNYW